MRDRKLIDRAQAMRREMPEPEMRLWLALRAKRFDGAKFGRQQVIEPYIANFACRTPRLLVEVDGDTHADRARHVERAPSIYRNEAMRCCASRTPK